MNYMDYMECEFSEARYWSDFYEELRLVEDFEYPFNYDATDFDWEYSKMICNSATYELIENSTTSAFFYLQKTFSYGDFFVMGFITLFILIETIRIIWQNFVKK